MKSKNKGGRMRAAYCLVAVVSMTGCGGGGSTQSTAAATPAAAV